MKKLSTWANQHRKKSIALLVLLHIIMGYFYFYTGTLLYLEGITTPNILVSIASTLFIVAWFFYPIKHIQQGIYKSTFFKLKFWQGVTMVSVALFFIHAGNHLSRSAMSNENVAYSSENIVLDSRKLSRINKKKERKLKRIFKKKLRKRLRSNIKKLLQLKKRSEHGRKILYYVLIILLAFGVSILLLALSCAIMCSGNEALGMIVLLGGIFLIIWGLVAIYRKMFKKGKKTRRKSKPTNG